MATYVGVDAGPSTGVCILVVTASGWQWAAFQVNGLASFWLIQRVIDCYRPRVVAIEQFVPSNRAGTKGEDAELTRRITEHTRTMAPSPRMRKAADVKPWATDKRLEKTGFPMGPKFKDARDAARHALFASVKDGHERDPLA